MIRIDSTMVLEAMFVSAFLGVCSLPGDPVLSSLRAEMSGGAPDISKPNGPHDVWQEEFIAGLRALDIDNRVFACLARFTSWIADDHKERASYKSPSVSSWEIERRETALALFAQDGKPLRFDVWVFVVRDRRKVLLQIPNFGKKSADVFFRAIDIFLAGNAQGRRFPVDSPALQRSKAVYERHAAGETYSTIAKEMGISNARVAQLGHRWARKLRN